MVRCKETFCQDATAWATQIVSRVTVTLWENTMIKAQTVRFEYALYKQVQQAMLDLDIPSFQSLADALIRQWLKSRTNPTAGGG